MIVEYVRYSIPADRREAFEGGYGEAQAALAASPHCLGYELTAVRGRKTAAVAAADA